jgi:hypothetical protein
MLHPAFIRFDIRCLEDPNRVEVEIEATRDAPPPSCGHVIVSAKMELWTGDNPTWQQLQLRAFDTLSRAFAIPDGLRHQLGGVYANNQISEVAAPPDR